MAGFQPAKACKVCQAVRADKKLFKRIYASKYYIKGGESLLSLSADTGLHYRALSTHVKKHQHMTDAALANSQLNEIAKATSRNAVAKIIRTGETRNDILSKLVNELEGRDLSELSAKDVLQLLLKGTKDSDDVKAKAKDYDLDIFKLVGGIRSGEVKSEVAFEEFDPWSELPEGELAN